MFEARAVLTLETYTNAPAPVTLHFCELGSTTETWKVEIIPHKRSGDTTTKWLVDLSALPDQDLRDVHVRIFDEDDFEQWDRIGKVLARPSGWRSIYDVVIDAHDLHQWMSSIDTKIDLYVTIVVTYYKKPLSDVQPRPTPLMTLSCDLGQLLLSGGSSDFTFEVNGEEISAHKVILSSRSSYFRGLIDSGMHEATMNRMTIDDIDATTFKAVLKFLYCGRFPEDFRTSAMKYIPVAEKYDLQELKDACQVVLGQSVTTENVVEVLIMADMYRCNILKPKAICRFMKFRTSLSHAQLKPLSAHPELMLECLKIE